MLGAVAESPNNQILQSWISIHRAPQILLQVDLGVWLLRHKSRRKKRRRYMRSHWSSGGHVPYWREKPLLNQPILRDSMSFHINYSYSTHHFILLMIPFDEATSLGMILSQILAEVAKSNNERTPTSLFKRLKITCTWSHRKIMIHRIGNFDITNAHLALVAKKVENSMHSKPQKT